MSSKIKIPPDPGWCGNPARGASRGRYNEPLSGNVQVEEMPLDEGGYDPGGSYWGLGDPMFVAEDDEGKHAYVRARQIEEAKEFFKKNNPNIQFREFNKSN